MRQLMQDFLGHVRASHSSRGPHQEQRVSAAWPQVHRSSCSPARVSDAADVAIDIWDLNGLSVLTCSVWRVVMPGPVRIESETSPDGQSEEGRHSAMAVRAGGPRRGVHLYLGVLGHARKG